MQAITPFLWFDGNAEDAVKHYLGIFPNSALGRVLRYGKNGMGREGGVMTLDFTLNGMQFTALNGGPLYSFSSATSFTIHCGTQQEVDHYWEKLGAGGRHQPCGWLVDGFGVTWQVVPTQLPDLLASADEAVVQRVTQAMLQMTKLDIAALAKAAAG